MSKDEGCIRGARFTASEMAKKGVEPPEVEAPVYRQLNRQEQIIAEFTSVLAAMEDRISFMMVQEEPTENAREDQPEPVQSGLTGKLEKHNDRLDDLICKAASMLSRLEV